MGWLRKQLTFSFYQLVPTVREADVFSLSSNIASLTVNLLGFLGDKVVRETICKCIVNITKCYIV